MDKPPSLNVQGNGLLGNSTWTDGKESPLLPKQSYAALPLVGERRRSKIEYAVYDGVIRDTSINPAYRPRHLWAGGARHY